MKSINVRVDFQRNGNIIPIAYRSNNDWIRIDRIIECKQSPSSLEFTCRCGHNLITLELINLTWMIDQ